MACRIEIIQLKVMKKFTFVSMKYLRWLTVIIFIGVIAIDVSAQCPMCRMAAESNLENGGTAGTGLNTGILYMLSLPYLLVGVIAFIWYKNRKTDIDILEESLQENS